MKPQEHAETVPFETDKCVLHKEHRPVPSELHLHHVFPKYLQLMVWKEVREKRTVPVCPTGHVDVHGALDAFLTKTQMPKGIGHAEWQLATEGFNKYNAAVKKAEGEKPEHD